MEIFKNKENSMMNTHVLILQLHQLSCGLILFYLYPSSSPLMLVD